MKLNCLVVDDEPVARKGIAEYVNDIEFLNLVAQCESGVKAATFLNEQDVIDLIFLDIQMPKLSGIDFLKTLKNPPLIIFTTAFSEYAVEGYSLDVVDYLMKPITFDRFLKAAQKARDLYQLKRAATISKDTHANHFFVKCDSKFEKILYNEVRYIEAMQNYAIIYTIDRKLITYITMGGLESQLPRDQFIKVHKSFIVAIRHVKALDGNDILVGDSRIPISRNLKEEVVNQILGNKLFKR
jgi:DNA-binding LytR/AlgR family response regulator